MFVSSYLSFRLLGSALPHLSLAQLKEVLSGEVMLQYGEHVVSAQVRALIYDYPCIDYNHRTITLFVLMHLEYQKEKTIFLSGI